MKRTLWNQVKHYPKKRFIPYRILQNNKGINLYKIEESLMFSYESKAHVSLSIDGFQPHDTPQFPDIDNQWIEILSSMSEFKGTLASLSHSEVKVKRDAILKQVNSILTELSIHVEEGTLDRIIQGDVDSSIDRTSHWALKFYFMAIECFDSHLSTIFYDHLTLSSNLIHLFRKAKRPELIFEVFTRLKNEAKVIDNQSALELLTKVNDEDDVKEEILPELPLSTYLHIIWSCGRLLSLSTNLKSFHNHLKKRQLDTFDYYLIMIRSCRYEALVDECMLLYDEMHERYSNKDMFSKEASKSLVALMSVLKSAKDPRYLIITESYMSMGLEQISEHLLDSFLQTACDVTTIKNLSAPTENELQLEKRRYNTILMLLDEMIARIGLNDSETPDQYDPYIWDIFNRIFKSTLQQRNIEQCARFMKYIRDNSLTNVLNEEIAEVVCMLYALKLPEMLPKVLLFFQLIYVLPPSSSSLLSLGNMKVEVSNFKDYPTGVREALILMFMKQGDTQSAKNLLKQLIQEKKSSVCSYNIFGAHLYHRDWKLEMDDLVKKPKIKKFRPIPEDEPPLNDAMLYDWLSHIEEDLANLSSIDEGK
mmetsp:Transcript_6651/g.9665  ORF Transcript_6651/g.9665 Transcript_6651/m.9665 type:complete len:592 (-) Transcript_6651:1026-2801(-)